MATEQMAADPTYSSTFQASFSACCSRECSKGSQQHDCKNFRFHDISQLEYEDLRITIIRYCSSRTSLESSVGQTERKIRGKGMPRLGDGELLRGIITFSGDCVDALSTCCGDFCFYRAPEFGLIKA
jgi:hypothetical protein